MVDNKQQWKAWLYLAPAILLLIVFTGWPIVNTLRMAFLEGYNALTVLIGEEFTVGFGNFLKVLTADDFIECLTNTMLLTVLTVPLSTLLALLIAVALNSIKPLQKFLQMSQALFSTVSRMTVPAIGIRPLISRIAQLYPVISAIT